MKLLNFIDSRYKTYFALLLTYLTLSTLVRIVLYIFSFNQLDFSIFNSLGIFAIGFYYDLAVSLFFGAFYLVYLLVLPKKIIGSLADKTLTMIILSLTLFVLFFSLFAEFPFWEEFSTRFNFIAVDYLIYTYEVFENINQTYPIPLIIVTLFGCITLTLFIYKKTGALKQTFSGKTPFTKRLLITFPLVLVSIFYVIFANNKQADRGNNIYENELSKNGAFSFFAAYRANELDYDLFYKKIDLKEAYRILKLELAQQNQKYVNPNFDSIARNVSTENEEIRPNIILVTIESFSGDFLAEFGNQQNITPNYDKLLQQGIFFNNMYATGTRTVRGMEALTLCVPPTPGNSIVRRPNNDHLYSIATVLKQKNYDLKFVYGGDGYFDNMNSFFGGQGFDIVDRDRGNPLSDNIDTKRFPIADKEVTFENAWGICDEDIYKQSLKFGDKLSAEKKPFFQFIMTTSNHKPYTYPAGKIDIPQGSREGAVKYTDFALAQFLKEAQKKSWYKNTYFVVVADHCASSAGKWEINIDKHHIPALILNAGKAVKINTLCSQIDLLPSVFSLLNWKYDSEFYGKNIFEFKTKDERALIGNYRSLGLLKNNVFSELNDRKELKAYSWDDKNKTMKPMPKHNQAIDSLAIAYYQTASERFKNGKMKRKGLR